MGIVHDAAKYLPDLLDYMAEHYPTLTVKNGVLGRSSDIETTTMAQYKEQVNKKDLASNLRYSISFRMTTCLYCSWQTCNKIIGSFM